jgi:hypothetical protein
LKELLTRSRNPLVGGSVELISPQFEKSEQIEHIKYREDTMGGPGNIFMSHIPRTMDADLDDGHPITLKALKYNKAFSPQVSSTCPCVPRYHVSFERPRLYEELSE